MKTKAIQTGMALSALALAISPAMAADIRFDGFASLVAGEVLDDKELTSESFRSFDNRVDFQQNSLFAVQMRADLQDKLSATAQVIAKGSNDYKAAFNWGYLAYELSNEFTVKVGRFRNPLFMYSDFLDVGYAYHWISPPDSVYNLSGFDSSDGVMLEYQTDFWGWTSTATLSGGRTSVGLELGSLDSTNSMTASWSLNYDWFTVHAVHSESDVTVDAMQFTMIGYGLAAAGVSQDAIDDALMESDKGSFDGVGVSLDNGTAFAVFEYSEVATENSFAADPAKRWYVSGGVRTGDWTTYATIETMEAEAQEKARDAITSQLDPSIAGLSMIPSPSPTQQAQLAGLIGLRAGVAQLFNSSERDEHVYSIGVRYNFHPSACGKFEILKMDDQLNGVKPTAVAMAVDLVY